MNTQYAERETVTCRVERIHPFGVFVRLPDGTEGYIRRREMSLAGNVDPRQLVRAGESLQAVVLDLGGPGRSMELSRKRALPDPWEDFVQHHRPGEVVSATVKDLVANGVYVEIVPGLDGFIPLQELAPWEVEKPDDLLWIGDTVEAEIVALYPRTKKVRLSMRRHMERQAKVSKVLEHLTERKAGEEESLHKEDPAVVAEGERNIDPAIARRVGRILVVDDHKEVREPLVAWLHRLGFAADGAESPDEVKRLLSAHRYGLALIDLDLSGDDGLGLIQALEKAVPDTRVAVMSIPEWIAERSAELAASGVSEVFAKPLNLDEIREALVHLGRGEALEPLWTGRPEPSEDWEQSSFQRLAETMRSGRPLVARFEAGLKELTRFTRAEVGLIFHLHPDSQQVSIVAQAGDLPLNRKAIYALAESPVKDLIHEGGEVFETHVSHRARRRFNKLLALLSFESCIGVPIPAGGEVQYALFLFHRKPDAFTRYRVRDAQAMAVLFSVALESQDLEQRIQASSPFLLIGHLAAGFGHEVYNKMSGLEIQLRNLRADHERLERGWESLRPAESFDFIELGRAMDRLLDVALDLKHTVGLFRELTQVEQEEEVDVNEVVQRAVLLLRPTARRQRVRIEMDLAPGLPPITGSAARLQQVFANVLLNAVQHTAQKMERWPDGRGALQITTALESEKERPIRVRVTDNGPGIHRQLWQNIFALGFSTRPRGTGLGLFIARSLTESMGGRIVVERSVIPIGTTFRVELWGRKP